MNAITPMNPVEKRIADETAVTLSHPISLGDQQQSATVIICRSRGGVGASTAASTIFCLADAEKKGTFIEVSGLTGYAFRAHKGAKFHVQNSNDLMAEILDSRIARFSELTIIELEPGRLEIVKDLYHLLGSTCAGPVHIIYVADENEDDPTFVGHLARAGLPIPMVVTKPTSAMRKSRVFVTLPRLGGDIKSSFYRDHSTLTQAISDSTQQGSKLMLNFELRAFRQQIEEYCRG
ncbi:hypothetical protein [Croceicoccus mobilis]|uniref:Uncharacterized protein n=1 Tax=Croceicoccus mobilis TaxID=1703339 RepID=A0A916Z833_9SPHN|nr:hypothetical protein [Croceicoccus mobilis]GGD81100.1 hypothetical protein GCM10010990_33810 [Croceicoccus mobilis]